MMKHLSVLIGLLSFTAFSQGLDWAKTVAGSNTQEVYGVAVDQSGNVYSTGEFWGTPDFDPNSGSTTIPSQGGADIFVQKYDVNGNLLWAFGFGSSGEDIGRAIDVDQNGNTYITGSFRGTIDFDPGPGNASLTTGGYSDIFVLKLDANGGFVWAKNFESFVDYSTGLDIKVDAMQNVYTTGKMKGSVDFDPGPLTNTISAAGSDIFIHKLTSNGALDWVRTYGGSGQWVEEGQSLEIDENGDIYVSGIFMSTVDFDASFNVANLTVAGSYPNVFVLKLKPSADFVWVKGYGSTSNQFPSGQDMAISGNNLFIVGKFNGTADFDPGAGVENHTSEGSGDIYIEKLDTAGNFQWVKTMGNFGIDRANSVATDYFGNAYVTGAFAGTVDFNADTIAVNELISEGNLDAFVLKLNELGGFEWVYPLADGGADEGFNIVSNQFGTSIWTSGSFWGTVDFDFSGVTTNISSLGLADGFIQKINQSVSCIPTFQTISPALCFGGVYSSPSGNNTWSQSGTYMDTINNVNGCDSILTINLTILPEITSQFSVSICDGASFTSPSGNYSWNQAGTYLDTISSAAGCDSVMTIDLTILPEITGQLSTIICDGDSFTSPSGNYSWNQAGTYLDTLPSAAGCDSIISIDISLTTLDNTVQQLSNVLTANQTGASYQWINCDNNMPIPGETNVSFTASMNGNYAVEITDQNCTVISSCVEVNTIGIDEISGLNIKAYPNPTSESVTIELPNDDFYRMEIVNITGELLRTDLISGQVVVLLPENSGVYFIRLTSDQTSSVVRVVKSN